MEENSELEGEAHCYKDDKDNIDPDTDLSYIDEKVQDILGHYRKDFEGGVSKETLGAKFGGYGSFLPPHERSPSNCSHAKTPQSDSNKQISQFNLSMEGSSQNFQPVSNVSSFTRFGTVSCTDHSLQNSGGPSGDVPMKHDLCLSSARVTEKFNIKDECSSRSGNLTDPRALRVRIKVSSNGMARKNMAIYSGLGLDNSPSTSSGNSAEESGGTNLVSRETADESPTSILQVMTSFPVPGGILLSPLHDSLFCLTRKEGLLRGRECVPSLKGSQDHSAMSVDKSVASMGNRKLLKEKKANLLGKISRPVEQKHGAEAKDENGTAILKKKSQNETPGGKEINHNNAISLSNPECVFGSVKGLGRASEVSSGVDKDEASNRLFSSNLERLDSFESVSGHSGKSQKNGRSRSVVEVSEQVQTNSHREVFGYLRDTGRYKERKTHAVLKAHSVPSKCNDDSIVLSKQKVGNKTSIQVQDDIKSCSESEVRLVEGKKAKGNRSRRKAGIVSIKESSRDGMGVAPKNVATTGYGASTYQSKMQKAKSQKDINKTRVIHEDSLDTNLEQTNNQLERTSSTKPNKKVDSHVMHELSFKDAPFTVPSTCEGRHGADMVPAVGDPVVINENWVCCDNCYKWRLLPFGTIPEHLPDNWLCSMLNWLPGMNHCDISEEETTKALYALDQLPVTEGQNNLHSYANGPASVITLDHGQHLDQKHQSPDSAAVPVQAKKRVCNNGGIQISNTTKNHLQDSVKSRSLNDKKHPPSESNEMKGSNSLHFIKSCNSDFDNSITKHKKELMNGGDSKKLKMKKKRDADQPGYGSSKKAKIAAMYKADRHRNSAVDRGKFVLKPNPGLQTEANGNNILNEHEDAKSDAKKTLLLSRKKLGGQAWVSFGGSFDERMEDKRNNSQTKRKWQDNQNGHGSREYTKEESSESGFGGEKKSRVQKSGDQKFRGNKGADDKSNNSVVSLFSTEHCVVDGMADVRSVDMGQKNQKNRRDFASQQTSNAIEPVRRHFGSGEVSVAATSSSSKVSGYCKNRADYEVLRGSPAESVSSSPYRTSSYPDKLTFAAEDILGKDDGGTDCVLVNNNCKRFLDGEGNCEINQSGTASKENDFSNFRPQPTKFSSFDYHDSNFNHESTHKVPSEFGNDHCLNGGADSSEHHQHIIDMHVIEHSNDEGRGNQNSHENVLLPQKVDSGYFLHPKDSNRSHATAAHRDKMKITDSSSEHHDLHLKKSLKHESDNLVDHSAHYFEVICEGKSRFPERSRSKLHKNGKNHIRRRDHERQIPSGGRMEKQVIVREQHGSDVKLCTGTKREDAFQWNLMQDLDGEVKVTQLDRGAVNGMSMLLSSESKDGQSKNGCRSVRGSQQGGMSKKVLIDNSCKADVMKASKYSGNEGKENELSLSLEHHSPDVIKDLKASIDISMKSSSQNAMIALKQAKELRDYADRLKVSGFDFESNEAYFQSALKFFYGASLLETCNGETGRNGEMTQIQAYGTAAKLCEFCGQGYERRQEMPAASLAYKCMEVAYMRVVYCKQSSAIRDLNKLQATLHKTSQGESPSSSASDVDNLNNQMTADKSLTSKGKGCHVTGNCIVVGQNRPSFIRLFNFTQDVDFAMEASRKSLNAFAVASVTLEEAQNGESIPIIKRVIDFSFQDVERFLRLVRHAMEALNPSGFIRD